MVKFIWAKGRRALGTREGKCAKSKGRCKALETIGERKNEVEQSKATINGFRLDQRGLTAKEEARRVLEDISPESLRSPRRGIGKRRRITTGAKEVRTVP